MSAQAPQNYANHRRFDKLYMVVEVLVALAVILSIAGLVKGVTASSLSTFLLAVIAVVLVLKVRLYSLTVQDRIVRLEMRLRLERVLPPDLKDRIPDLTLSQLIGLRFASDGELPTLVRQVLDERITKADEIKKRVKNWQADHLRV